MDLRVSHLLKSLFGEYVISFLLKFNFWILLLFILFEKSILSAKQAVALLQTPITAKANALGSTYTGSVKDPSALLWNPAGLAHISGEDHLIRGAGKIKKAQNAFKNFKRNGSNIENTKDSLEENEDKYHHTFEFQFLSTVTQLSLERKIGFVGIGFPILIGSLGFGILGSQVQGIYGYDQDGISTGELEYNLYSVYAGYAFEKGPTRLGFSVNGILENLAGKSLGGGSITLGIQFFASIFELGATLQSLAGFMQKSISELKKLERLDIILRLSTSVVIPRTKIRLYFGLTSNLDNYQDSPPLLNIGFSYDIFKYVSLLLGLNGGRPSVGLELKFPNIGMTYALNQDKLSHDIQHYIDVYLKF